MRPSPKINPDAPGQLRLQAGRRVQGLLSGSGENCLGEEVASQLDCLEIVAKWPTSSCEKGAWALLYILGKDIEPFIDIDGNN